MVCARSVWRSSGGARRLRGGGRGWGQRGQSALLHRDLHSQPTRHSSPCNCVGARTFRPPGQRNSLRPFLVPSRSLPFTWQWAPQWAPQRAPQRVPEPRPGRRPSGRRPSGRGRGRGRGRGQAPPPWEPPATNERSSGLFPAYSRDTGRGSSREGEGRGRPAFDRSGVCGARARRAPGTPPGGGAGGGGGAPPSWPPSWAPRPWAPGAPVGPWRASSPSPPRPCRRARPPLQASSQVGGACCGALWAMRVLGTAAGARDVLEAHSARVHGPEALWDTHLALLATSCVAFLTSPLALSASF